MRSRSSKALPLSVRRALKKLGSDLADARKRRRISTTTMAQRAMISRTTLVKFERGVIKACLWEFTPPSCLFLA